MEKGAGIDFPDSIVSFFEGMMGQPEGGFPEDLQKLVLKDKKPIKGRPGELLPPEDFDYIKNGLQKYFELEGTPREIISYAMYPKDYYDNVNSIKKDGDFSLMGSDVFFYGLAEGETAEVKIDEGKELVIRLNEVRDVDKEGFRDLVFEVNGNRKVVKVKDNMVQAAVSDASSRYADEENPMEIGANIPGTIVKILVHEGDEVKDQEPIAVIEAMKMETNIIAKTAGTVEKIFIKKGQQVKSGELIALLK